MSDWDDMDMDDLEGMYEEREEVTPEDVFKMTTINRRKKTKLTVELRDDEDDIVLIPEVVEELINYMKDKLKDGEKTSQFTGQIMPLMSQALVSGLGRLLGIRPTGALLFNEIIRYSLVQMMSMSMLLLKFIQDKKLKIFTYEEECSQEELDAIEQKFERTRVDALEEITGITPTDLIKQAVNQGMISREDLEALLEEEKKKDN